MFSFRRVGRDRAETWQILVAEREGKGWVSRFGKPLCTLNPDRPRSHEIGVVVAIDRGEETELLLAVKQGLTDAERRILDGEVEELLGRGVYQNGAEDENGWFRWDTLSDA